MAEEEFGAGFWDRMGDCTGPNQQGEFFNVLSAWSSDATAWSAELQTSFRTPADALAAFRIRFPARNADERVYALVSAMNTNAIHMKTLTSVSWRSLARVSGEWSLSETDQGRREVNLTNLEG